MNASSNETPASPAAASQAPAVWGSPNAGWLLTALITFVATGGALRLMRVGAFGALASGLGSVAALLVLTLLMGGFGPTMRLVVWANKWWLARDHSPLTRALVIAALSVMVLACFAGWLFAEPGARLWPAIALGLSFSALLAYAGHKCCRKESTRAKTCVAAASFLAGVLGNYTASATAGEGTDARAIDDALRPLVDKIDGLAADLGLIKRDVGRLVKLSEENGKKIDAIAAKLLAMVEQRDATIGELQKQLRAAVERAVRAEMAAGKSPDEAVSAVERKNPTQIIESLDGEIARSTENLKEKHRERSAVCYVAGEIDKAVTSLNVILALAPDDLDAINELGNIQLLRGELEEAAQHYARVGKLATGEIARAVSYCNLGNVELARENLDAAERHYKQAMVINTKLQRREGMAIIYGRLGVIEQRRGNLDAAESNHMQSLQIADELGLLSTIADQFGDLGLLQAKRGNPDAAEACHLKSLSIYKVLESQEGMARQFGNLGTVETMRGNLDGAEAYHKKALAINEKLGRPEGIAIQCVNLGSIANSRGDKAEARRLWTLARNLYRKIGAKATEQNLQALLDKLE